MEIIRGTVSTIIGWKCRIVPKTSTGVVTRMLSIPGWLQGTCEIDVGTEVVALVAEDGTGLLLSRYDGDWHPRFIEDVIAEDVSLEHHTHAGVHGETSGAHR